MKVLILSTRHGAFENDKGGEVVYGEVTYVTGERQVNEPNSSTKEDGCPAISMKVPRDLASQIGGQVPAVYDAEFQTKLIRDSRGRRVPSLVMVAAQFVAAVDLVKGLAGSKVGQPV